MNDLIIDLGFISIKWYSVLILLGIIMSYFYIVSRAKKSSINKEDIIDIFFWTIVIGIFGARIYYVIFNIEYYVNNLLDIFMVWNGGLAIHGGIIFGIITCIYMCKKKNINVYDIFDIFAPALIFSQGIGRWGNFFNQEAYGSITTRIFLEKLHIPKFIINNMYINGNYYHPTFLYESIFCFIGLVILIIYAKTNYKRGNIFGIYLIWYGLLRIFIEYLRVDSLMIFNVKAAYIISIIMIVVGIFIIRRKDEKRI
ncbi:MAG TPA: prolipoprotein diacylglyceryl transferase [Bacilli bacterium]|nr:prolipoprotein diacylglyceryl transferase [Bacilli bacterium]